MTSTAPPVSSTYPELTYVPVGLEAPEPQPRRPGCKRQRAVSDVGDVTVYWCPDYVDIAFTGPDRHANMSAYMGLHGGIQAPHIDGRPVLRFRYPRA
jgi:hypothetical protein